ncbi:MAG TPA: hypothetical protein VF086_09615 [Propionibacteriaceae bacterium]
MALELRAAADLRRLQLANGRPDDAARILRPTVEKFTEGHDLPDLRDATEIAPLSWRHAAPSRLSAPSG